MEVFVSDEAKVK